MSKTKKSIIDQDPYQGNQDNNNLAYYEVKQMSDDYNVPCKAIYELHAEFSSMMKIN